MMLPKRCLLLFRVVRRGYSTRSFKDLNVSPIICNNLQRHFAIEKPTIAQSQFIPVIQSGHDLLLRDRTGTGKTFGIAVALASKLLNESSTTRREQEKLLRSLYIVPNHELAIQIEHWMRLLLDGTPLSAAAFDSARNNSNDILATHPHTLIGTPARLLGSVNTLPIRDIDCIVIEEADQALRLPTRYAPLKKQKKRASNPKPTQSLVDHILGLDRNKNKKKPQLIVASATLNRPLRHWMLKTGWTDRPTFIDITKNVEAVNEQTQHYCLLVSGGEIRNIGSFYNLDEQMRNDNDHNQQQGQETSSSSSLPSDNYQYDNATALIESVAVLNGIEQVNNGVLFVDTSISTSDIARRLAEFGIRARDIRDYEQYKNDKEKDQGQTTAPLWIATEFSARGMDIDNVSHVFILGEPSSVSGYVHMAGRTGRLGPQGMIRGGKVITLVEDKGKAETRMTNIYKMLNAQVEHYDHVQ